LADWASAAVGAHDALQKLVAQRMFEQKQAEVRQQAEWERQFRERDLSLREDTARQTREERAALDQSLVDQRNASIAAADAKRKADEEAARRTAETRGAIRTSPILRP
jgi:hypothetical protein